MTRVCWTVLGVAVFGATLAAQGTQDSRRGDQDQRRTLTLTGCVERGATPTQYVIEDLENGRFEVSGNQIGKYLGQRVRVAGQPGSTRFRVRGGLWPSPNAAGRAGAMSPGRAAVEAMPGGPNAGTGEINLPTFKVRSIRTLDGTCE
jgi:hypothetical protein